MTTSGAVLRSDQHEVGAWTVGLTDKEAVFA